MFFKAYGVVMSTITFRIIPTEYMICIKNINVRLSGLYQVLTQYLTLVTEYKNKTHLILQAYKYKFVELQVNEYE